MSGRVVLFVEQRRRPARRSRRASVRRRRVEQPPLSVVEVGDEAAVGRERRLAAQPLDAPASARPCRGRRRRRRGPPRPRSSASGTGRRRSPARRARSREPATSGRSRPPSAHHLAGVRVQHRAVGAVLLALPQHLLLRDDARVVPVPHVAFDLREDRVEVVRIGRGVLRRRVLSAAAAGRAPACGGLNPKKRCFPSFDHARSFFSGSDQPFGACSDDGHLLRLARGRVATSRARPRRPACRRRDEEGQRGTVLRPRQRFVPPLVGGGGRASAPTPRRPAASGRRRCPCPRRRTRRYARYGRRGRERERRHEGDLLLGAAREVAQLQRRRPPSRRWRPLRRAARRAAAAGLLRPAAGFSAASGAGSW